MADNYVSLCNEPAGELFFGKLTDAQVEQLKNMHGTEEFNDTDIVNYPTDYAKCLEHITAMTSWDYNGNTNVIQKVNIPEEDGFYVVAAFFSKYDFEFEIPVDDEDDFDEDDVSADVISFDFKNICIEDNYSVTKIDMIKNYKYKDEDIEAADDAEMMDNGIDKQITIFQVHNKVAQIIFKYRPYDGDEAEWGEFLN